MKKNSGTNSGVGPKSIHFTLRASTDSASLLIDILHRYASICGFKKVSELNRFVGDSCAVIDSDRFRSLKIHSRGMALIGSQSISYMPKSFYGFECDMMNDKKLYVGLSEFEDSITLPDGSVWKTGLNKTSQWQDYVKTYISDDKHTVTNCVDSHRSVCKLMSEADTLGILSTIRDPTGYWKNRDRALLAQKYEELDNH